MRRTFRLVLLVLAGLVLPLTAAFAWEAEVADAAKNYDFPSHEAIALDPAGRPHIVYGRDHLYHAYFDGTRWQTEIADVTPLVGTGASIAIDAGYNIHVSYVDSANHALKYAYHSNGVWQVETVDAALTGGDTAIAVDGSRRAHISYTSADTGALKYATGTFGLWTKQVIYADTPVMHHAIASEDSGEAHVSFYTDRELKHAERIGTTWLVDTADDTAFAGQYNSIAVDFRGNAYISYYDYGNDALKVAVRYGASWFSEIVDNTDVLIRSTAIAVDGSQKVHVSYTDSWTGVKYASGTLGAWQLGGLVADAHDSSITVHLTGIVHISYYDDATGDLRYAAQSASGWQSVMVDRKCANDGYAPVAHPDLAMDATGNAHLSYAHVTTWPSPYVSALKYATNAHGNWRGEIVDEDEVRVEDTSIVLDAAGNAHIAYYDAAAGVLKYATNSSGRWETKVVDSFGDVGAHNDIAIDRFGYLHISYYDKTRQDLKYATNAWVEGVWSRKTIDSTNNAGQHTAVAVDAAFQVHIAYYYTDGTKGAVLYAKGSFGGTFTREVVDSNIKTPGGIDLALDSADKPHLAYSIRYNGWLPYHIKHAANTSGVWRSEATEITDTSTASWPSIAMDTQDRPHINYWYARYDVLRHTVKTSSGWVGHNVDVTTDAGAFASTATIVDAQDNVHVAYVETAASDIKYATDAVRVMAMPDTQRNYALPTAAAPTVSTDPTKAIPIGWGDVAVGGDTISVQIAMQASEAAADLYLGLFSPALNPSIIFLVTENNTFRPHTLGMAPWKRAITTGVDESLFGDIPADVLPPGPYVLGVIRAPAGDMSRYDFWTSMFTKTGPAAGVPSVSNLVVPAVVCAGESFRIQYEYADPTGLDDVAMHHIVMSDGYHGLYPAGGTGRFDVGGFYYAQPGAHWVRVYVVDQQDNQSNTLEAGITVNACP